MWRAVAGTLGGLGLLGAVLCMHPSALLAVSVVSGLVAAGACCTGPGERLMRAHGTRVWLGLVGTIAAALVAGAGVLASAGGSALLLWVSALAGSWLLLGRPVPRRAMAQGSVAVTSGPSSAAPPDRTASGPSHDALVGAQQEPTSSGDVHANPTALRDDELCRRWRRSLLHVHHTTDPVVLDRVARTRQGYLDELQRRHRRQFALWLDSGARAASDPARYLTTRSTTAQRATAASSAAACSATDDDRAVPGEPGGTGGNADGVTGDSTGAP